MSAQNPAHWMVLASATIVALYLLGLFALFAAQRQILFRPDQGRPVARQVEQPGLLEVLIVTADGLDLLAWWLPPADQRGADQRGADQRGAGQREAGQSPVVLYLHGNAGHIGHRAERVRQVAARGWGGLFIGYRGYGGNPGEISEAGLRLDAEAGLAALHQRGIAAGRIVVWGESLGSGLATGLAARHAVGAVVLETPFTSIAAIAKQRYPFAPVDLLLKDRFDSMASIAAIRAPVLVAVAGRDRVVPPSMGHTLHEAATAPAELWEAPEAGHTDLLQFGLMAAMAAFLERHLPHR